MQKQKNSPTTNNTYKILAVALLIVLLMTTGVFGAIVELVFGLIFGILGLIFGVIVGVLGLGTGLIGGVIGIVAALLPILIPLAIVAIIIQAVSNRSTRKRKNDFV